MKLNWLDQLGEWNPQMFRELKGRFTRRNFWITVIGSLLSQVILLVVSSRQTCISYDAAGSNCLQYYWEFNWQWIYRTLNWVMPFVMLVSGVYRLINDVAQEERQGTLNFIRLSPQSSQSIFLGKMLGVPALLYLAIALAIPLHLGSALAAGLPFFWVLGIYTLWGVGCFLFYSAALLYTLQHGSQIDAKSLAGGGSVGACLFGLAYISAIDFSFYLYQANYLVNWVWFFLPIGRQPSLAYVLMFISVGVAAYWYWQAANRRFRNPKAPLISKQQSYWLVGSFELWLLGFSLQQSNPISADYGFITGGVFLFFLTPLFFLMVSAALAPGRQALLDWSRYRRDRIITRQSFWNRSLVQDLIRSEKSPAIVAIAINLLVTDIIWLPWMLLYSHKSWEQNFSLFLGMLLGWLLTINVVLIYTALIDLMLLIKAQKWMLFGCTAFGITFFPLLSWYLLGNKLLAAQFLLLFSPFPSVILTLLNGSSAAQTILLGILAQFGVLALLTLQLVGQLRKVGQSTSHALLNEHHS